MTPGLITGCIVGVVFMLLALWMWSNYRRASRYEKAVRAFIGDDHVWVWDDQIYFDYYYAAADPADCAREMVATNCEP